MKEYYLRETYDHSHRWMTYWYLIREVHRLQPGSILEAGIGNKFLSKYLAARGFKVTTLDIEASLEPDIVGSVTAMPAADDSYDLVICSQVLEHLPFEEFPKALAEIRRVAKKDVLISLPHWGWTFYATFKMPLFRKFSVLWKFPWAKRHVFDGDHYWEIGKKGYSLGKIKKTIEQAGFKIQRDFIRSGSPFHHFFVLQKV
ncbi:MAG TPA: methyltransferase domain-containing protein [Candidatus Paceibacterota bacterium]|nr:methyltransferase domain-containing protein [Candidatus Paceibacterota bacterium]